MVEVRHNLSIRRQKLREQIEYNESRIEDARNNIKKYTEMGEIKYVYDRSYDFEDERLLLSEKEYQKCFPDKFVKTTVAYYIIFEFSYETDHGKIKAKITLTKPVIEKTYNDDESEKDIQRFVEEFINEKENPKDEFEIILNGTTGKEMRWAIYSILAKQKQKQEYQSQRISSLQRVVILQGMAVIVLGLSIIIFKQCLL